MQYATSSSLLNDRYPASYNVHLSSLPAGASRPPSSPLLAAPAIAQAITRITCLSEFITLSPGHTILLTELLRRIICHIVDDDWVDRHL